MAAWAIFQSSAFQHWYRSSLNDEERDAIVATAWSEDTRAHAMTEHSTDFQVEIDAALADPVRRARVEQYGRQIDLILALSAIREAVGSTQEEFAAAALMSQENV